MKMGHMRFLCSGSEKSPVTLSWLGSFLLCLFKVSGSRPPAVLPSPLPHFSRCPLVPPTLLRLFQKLFSFALYSELAFGLTHGLCTGSSWPETCLHLFCPFQPSTAVCSSWRWAVTHKLLLPDWGMAPAHRQTQRPQLFLSNFFKYFHLKHPKESSVHLSTSRAEILSM